MIRALIWFIIGLCIGYSFHPYERCKSRYVGDENIGECVWLLKNQPALRY